MDSVRAATPMASQPATPRIVIRVKVAASPRPAAASPVRNEADPSPRSLSSLSSRSRSSVDWTARSLSNNTSPVTSSRPWGKKASLTSMSSVGSSQSMSPTISYFKQAATSSPAMSPPAPSVQQVGFQIEAGTASDRPAGRHNLQLQSFAMAASPRNSFMLTSSTFRAQGFTIGRNGMNAAAPSRMDLDVPVHKKSMFAVTNRMEPLDNLGIIANEETSFSDFELIGDSGRGASSSVLKAVRLDKFGMYALKSMDVHSQEKRHQLVKELTTFASLGRGPNIVKFHGAYYNAGRAMLVLEYMNRGSLMSVVEECGPLPPDVVAHFAKQIFFGLEYIHQRRLVHRDIKPGNILVSRKGRVKLTDFGLAETLRASRSCLTGFIGTQVYMSPERLEGAPYGPAADIWSAGLVVAYAALGRHPYSADEGFFGIIQEISQRPVPDLPAHFPPELRHLVACCLEVDPANRWTANALSQHPALANVRVNDELEWALGATSPADEEDCTAVAKILATKVYNFIETLTMNDIDDEDLLDIAESLGVPVEVIKEKTVKMHRRFTTRRHNGSVQ